MQCVLYWLASVVLSFAAIPAHAAAVNIKMYRLDCGHIRLADKNVLSDQGLYKGQSHDIVVSCYLIRHGKDWLLWDAGLPKKYLAPPRAENGITARLDHTIVDQIAALGLRPEDITHVAVSHAHFDHAGQLADFPEAMLIIQRGELDAMADTKQAAEHAIYADLFSTHIVGNKLTRVRVLDGDVDLFGDGTLKTIHTPGHTPGSMALLVDLKHAGKYVLSGDQWHTAENRVRQQVPTWNYDHAQTIASGKKLDAVTAQAQATLVIEHEPADNRNLPTLPRYLD
jgi:N-acyl homoserine lactone hydrolase